MLLDEVLPAYDISAKYSIRIRSTPDRIYKVLQQGLPVGSVTKLLMMLRGLPRIFQKRQTVAPEQAFYRLKESENHEIVLGIIGQFWKPVARPVPIHSLDEFLNFQRDGFCKAALNLKIEEDRSGICLITTETRVLAFGSASDPFREYWRVIGPFSGLIRKEILRKIKQRAERTRNTDFR